MNEKPDSRSRLIADLFHEDWENGTARDFARAAAERVRQQRGQRRTYVPAICAASAAVVLAFFVTRPNLHFGVRSNLEVPRLASGSPAPAVSPAGYAILSDDELMADLRDRPLLVLGNKASGRQFVLLSP